MAKPSTVNEELLREFNLIRQRFTSLETMAEALGAHEGFEDLNRATLSRWLVQPSRRTQAALEIMKSRRPPGVIRIAEKKKHSVIPSSLLQWDVEEGILHGLTARWYDLT